MKITLQSLYPLLVDELCIRSFIFGEYVLLLFVISFINPIIPDHQYELWTAALT